MSSLAHSKWLPARRTLWLGLIALLVGLITDGGAVNAQPADAEAIKAANAAYYAAVSSRDIVAVERIWAKDAPVFNTFGASKKPVVGWGAIKADYEDLFKRFVELSVTIPEPLVRHDGETALVVGVETLHAKLANGESANLTLPATNVFVKRGGQWLMVHHHTSRPPQ